MIHAKARTDCMSGTTVRDRIVSVFVNEENGIDNGSLAVLGDLMTNSNDKIEREIYNISKPTGSDDLLQLVFVCSPELVATFHGEDELEEFFNENGSIARAYRLEGGDIFSVTAEGFDIAEGEEISVGDYVMLGNSYKMIVGEDEQEGATTLGEIIGIDDIWGERYFVVEAAIPEEASDHSGGGGSDDAASPVVGTGVVGSMVVGTDTASNG